MPRLIDPGTPAPIDLPAFVAAVDDLAGVEGLDAAKLAALAPTLAGLGANRRFLGDLVLQEIEDRCARQVRANRYSAQVIMLHQADGWFARACLWPAAQDPAVRASGTAPFFYGVPHDHNFSFLTVGYLGPGYWSDYYERDPDAPDPLVGDRAGLVATGRRRLAPGQVMLYREARDVHCQWPADAFSVSINILPAGPERAHRSQYRFDPATDRVAARLTRSPLEALLPLAAQLGGATGADLLARVAAEHPSDPIRFAAVAALAGAAPDQDGRRAILDTAAGSTDGAVARQAMMRIRALDAAIGWRTGTGRNPDCGGCSVRLDNPGNGRGCDAHRSKCRCGGGDAAAARPCRRSADGGAGRVPAACGWAYGGSDRTGRMAPWPASSADPRASLQFWRGSHARRSQCRRRCCSRRLWGARIPSGSNLIAVHLSRLRAKLSDAGAGEIETVPAQGWRLAPAGSAAKRPIS